MNIIIFGIPLANWLAASALILTILWLFWYIRFVFGKRKEIKVSPYFRGMFEGFKKSGLRVVWKSIIFGLMYLVGLIVTAFIKSAWYPAKYTRKLFKFIFIAKKD